MRRFVAVAMLVLCSSILACAQGGGSPTPVIAGTVWTGTVVAPQADGNTQERLYRCEFSPDGRVTCAYGQTSTPGIWFQNERLFLMNLNDSYSSWVGAIDGDRITGNSVNKLGHKWNWMLTRQSSVAGTPVPLPPAAWIVHSDVTGRFSISMPGKPVRSEQPVDTAAGKLINNVFMVQTPKAAFLISYVDHPVSENPQPVLERVRDGAVKGIKGKLLTSTSITHKGFPGFEFTASAAEVTYTSRIYLVNNRLYQIVAVAAPGSLSEDIKQYLASFDLKLGQ